MSSTATTLALCSTADVPEGGALKVERDGLILAVFNLGGRFFVTDDTCTHGPGSLSEGEIDCDDGVVDQAAVWSGANLADVFA